MLASSYQNIYKVISLGAVSSDRLRYVMSSSQFEVDGVILHSQFLFAESAGISSTVFAILFIEYVNVHDKIVANNSLTHDLVRSMHQTYRYFTGLLIIHIYDLN